jgi:hypothetical protein
MKALKIFALLAAIATFAITSCKDKEETTYKVTFDVVTTLQDENSTTLALEEAKIVINGITLVTDENGQATIALEDGKYDYEVSAVGYYKKEGSVTVDGADILSETVEMKPEIKKRNVTFKVFDVDEEKLQDATVTIGEVEKITDKDGEARFELEAGEYTYVVSKEGYDDEDGTVTVEENMDKIEIVIMKVSTTPLGDWYDEFKLGHKGQSWSEYKEKVCEAVGIEYTGNNTSVTPATFILKATSGSEFVIVTSDDYTTKEELVEVFEAGAKVTEFETGFDVATKAFAPKIFIAKNGEEYLLVKTTAAEQHDTKGNYVGLVWRK